MSDKEEPIDAKEFLDNLAWQPVRDEKKEKVRQLQAEEQLQQLRERINKERMRFGSWFGSPECTSEDTRMLAWILNNFDLIWRGDAQGIERAKIISEVNKAQNVRTSSPPIRLVLASGESDREVQVRDNREEDYHFPPE